MNSNFLRHFAMAIVMTINILPYSTALCADVFEHVRARIGVVLREYYDTTL